MKIKNKQFIVIAGSIVAALALSVWLAFDVSNDKSAPEIALSNAPIGTAPNAASDELLTQVLAELRSLKVQTSQFQAELAELKEVQDGLRTGTSASDQYNGDGQLQDYYRLYGEIVSDPEKLEKIRGYEQQIQIELSQATHAYFDSLEEVDEAWASEAAAFLDDSVAAAPGLLNSAQVNDTTCKSKVCKVSMVVPLDMSSDPSTDRFIAENELLIAVSKKFPKSRLSMVERDGKLVIDGYVAESSVQFPELSDIDRGDVSLELIESIIR